MANRIQKFFTIIIGIMLLFFFSILLIGCGNKKEKKKYVDIPQEYFVEFNMLDNAIYSNGKEIAVSKYNSIMQQIENTLIAISKAVNTTIEDSTVSKINRASVGERIKIDPYTKELLQISTEAFQKSKGKFSPALYNLSQIWGFTPEFEGQYNKPRPEPSPDEITNAKQNSNFEDIVVDFKADTVTKRNANVKLDFGGIAKGYMADKVKQIIEDALSNTQIDCGFAVMSNTVLLGQKRQGNVLRGFNIAVENPRTSVTGNGYALVLQDMQNVAVSTSADTYRFYSDGKKIYSHILDVNSGKPSENGVMSATVIVPTNRAFSSTWTDIYSTLGFCMPLTEVLNFYEQEKIGATVITNDYNYYTVGTYNILNRNEFDNKQQNYYTNNTGKAVNTFAKSEKEKEYIINMQKGKKVYVIYGCQLECARDRKLKRY